MTQAGGTQMLAARDDAPSKRRRNGIIAIVAAVAWMALIYFAWADTGMNDSVPTGEVEVVDRRLGVTTRVFTTQMVRCNGLFADELVAEPLPALEPPRSYARPPCEQQRREGRLLFIINAALVGAVIVGGAVAIASKDTGDADEAAIGPSTHSL